MFSWNKLTPADAAQALAAFDRPWWIAGGWAVDLALGRGTREHGDIDIAILRGDELSLAKALPGWDIRIAHDGQFIDWDGGILQPPMHQFWARRDAAAAWDLEFLLEDHADGWWRCRRDPRVCLPLEDFGRETPDGQRYVAPAVVLLYKAKGHGIERNRADFEALAPGLDPASRGWLRDALEIAHPGHPWLLML